MHFLDISQIGDSFLKYATKYFTVWIASLMLYLFYRFRKYSKLPPGPYSLPFVGYLPFLGAEPHKTLNQLSKEYGNIFSFYLGRQLVIVLGDFTTMKSALTNPVFLGRPPDSPFNLIPEKLGMATSNGPLWQEQRRYAVTSLKHLISKIQRLEETIQGDLNRVVEAIQEREGKPFVLRPFLTASSVNNIWFLLFGERIPFDSPIRKFMSEVVDTMASYFGMTSEVAFFPWISYVYSKLKIGGYDKALTVLKDMNVLVRKHVDNRLKTADENDLPFHFATSYIQHMEENEAKTKKGYFSIPTLRGTMQGFFLGGSETTRTSVEWALYTMALYPEVQRRVQKEVDDVIGRERTVYWKDHSDMPYTQAVLAEMHRWKTIVPINGLRYTLEDVTFRGYNIPKNTTIMMNIWAVHNDPDYWKNPEEFRPERFLSDDGKVFSKPERFIPFTLGRRKCPGEEMATTVIFIVFTTIMQKFTVTTPPEKKLNVDDFKLGLTYQPMENELCFLIR